MASGARLGRPRKLPGPTKLIAVWMPVALLDRVDHFARRRLVGASRTRADALRYLVERALDDFERDDAALRATARSLSRALAGRALGRRGRPRQRSRSARAK